MKPLYTEKQYLESKGTGQLPCQCYCCGSTFYRMKKNITFEIKHKRGRVKFCSQKCNNSFNNQSQMISLDCYNCELPTHGIADGLGFMSQHSH